MANPVLLVEVPSNELQYVLLGLRFRLEDASLCDDLKAPYLAAYLAVEAAWLKALYPRSAKVRAGAFLQAALRGKPSRPPVFACFQKSTRQRFSRWLRRQSRTTAHVAAPMGSLS